MPTIHSHIILTVKNKFIIRGEFIYVICTIVFITFFTVSVSAEDNYDSVNIDPEELSLMKDSSDDTVVKLYGGMFMPDFAEKKNIEEIINDDTSIDYMVISKNGNITYKNYRNGKINIINPANGISDWSEFYKYAISPEKVFGYATEIYNVYCLDGESSHDGVYIYYFTDKGEYVLYKEYLSADEEYLIPIADFYNISKVIHEERLKFKFSEGGGRPIDELLDMKSYVFRDNTYLYFVIPILIISIVIGSVIGIIIYKKKKASSVNKTVNN